ncbi:MAG: hypothetical protein J7497_13255 [Chitinophagaceae bacterium]|nr:hypothetical protein [Chitinophagaceae bacterium]
MYKKIKLLGIFTVLVSLAQAQTDNSPYSRYGLGNQTPGTNVMLRGMGGLGAAYSDILSVNFTNPASYSRLKRTTFDFAVELDSRTLREIDPPQKYTVNTPIITYLQFGLPLSKTRNWGMNIGLRPVNNINYQILKSERLEGIDSVRTLYQGNGGAYEVYTGTGFGIGKLSLGFNIGYLFGNKNYSSSRTFVPDSSNVFYLPARYSNETSYGGFFGMAGAQYTITLAKKNMLRLGAYGRVKREFNAHDNRKVFTYTETQNGTAEIDVVTNDTISGKITYPSSYGFGAIYHSGEKWLLGVDFAQAKWSEYRYFGAPDSVQDSWKLSVGGQVVPNATSPKSYWGRVTYRAGISFGQDYVKVGNSLPVWTASFGLGLPLRPPSYTNQFSIINTTFEFGKRGNDSNSLTENFFRISLGLTLSDIWFIKRKYD